MIKSGRQGIRTLITFRCHALAMRPGKPYPATFLVFIVAFKWSTGESNPDLLYAKQMSSRWTSTPFHFLLQHAPKDSNPDILGWNQQCYRYTKGVQFFVFVCLNLTSIAIQNFSGNARNRTSRQLPHNLRQEGYNLPCGNAPPRISQAPALTRRVTISSVQRKPWDSNPQRFYPQLFSKQCPHPAG